MAPERIIRGNVLFCLQIQLNLEGRANMTQLKLPNNIIFMSIVLFFFLAFKEGPNYTTSTVVVWRRKFLIAVLQKSNELCPIYWCLSGSESWFLSGIVLGSPHCDIIQINFEDNTSTILLFIPLYTIFFNTLGNPAQVKSAPSRYN